MAYTKQTWHDLPTRDTPVSAARLAHMEDGIEAAAATADEALTSASSAQASELDRGTFSNWSGQVGISGSTNLTFAPGDEYGTVGDFTYSDTDTKVTAAAEGVWAISVTVALDAASEAATATVVLLTGSDAANMSANLKMDAAGGGVVSLTAPVYYYPADGAHAVVQVALPGEATVNVTELSVAFQRIA